MPRLIRFHELGGPEVLRIEEAPVPEVGTGCVRIQVKAIGLNRADAMLRRGQYIKETVLPSRLGYEAAGIIDAVGNGVVSFQPGDEVAVIPQMNAGENGTYCEMLVAPAHCVVHKPAAISFTEAAAVWMQYLTAYGGLIETGKLKKKDYVVITAASSSVGLAAIQLANYAGAVSIATTRTSNKKHAVKKAGAHHAIATNVENLLQRLGEITDGKGIQKVFDAVGGQQVADFAEAMSPGGILVAHGMLSPEPTLFPLKAAITKSLTLRGYVFTEITDTPALMQEAKSYILAGLESGHLRPVISKTFDFAEIEQAHRYLESNTQTGKIVVTV